ncbi:MAG: hypothetical protein HY695_33190 [Deltaproteobacteria bacterium]|nr:hypothetical protein [Deltaproteobacteria bacterium]
MGIELAGFIVGLIGAIWLKASMHLLNQEKSRQEKFPVTSDKQNPAVGAFIKGISLILIGLVIETFARLFSS